MPAQIQSPATVLVVEDESLIKLSIILAVEDQGYLVLSASNATEALAVLAQHFEVDVLLTDINMPGSMDGLELARDVQRDHPLIEIIVASGRGKPKDRDLPAGAVFLQKPYSLEQLGDVLRAKIDQTRPFVL